MSKLLLEKRESWVSHTVPSELFGVSPLLILNRVELQAAAVMSSAAMMARIEAISGATVAELDAEQLRPIVEGEKPVRALKEFLAAQIGLARFRLRLLEDTVELHDEAPLPLPPKLRLVVLNYQLPDALTDQSFVSACAENRLEDVERMLQAPQDPDTKDFAKPGITAMLLAAEKGHAAVVRLLLEAGAERDITEAQHGRTAFHLASQKGHAEVVRVLLQAGANPNAEAENRRTALQFAARNGHTEVVYLLLDAGAAKDAAEAQYGMTALYVAASKGRTEAVRLLLDADAAKDVAETGHGRTALHVAASNGHAEVVRLLLQAGAEKDAEAEHRRTALQFAARNGHAEVVHLLLEAGAEKDAAEAERGRTALHVAAFNGHTEVVRSLLQAGAEKDAASHDGKRPLEVAARHGHTEVMELLVLAGARPKIEEDEGTICSGGSRYPHQRSCLGTAVAESLLFGSSRSA